MNDRIRLVELPSELSIKRKGMFKKQNEIPKPAEVVRIYKCDKKYSRQKYQSEAASKHDQMKSELRHNDLRDEMILNPDDYRLMELSPSDYQKIHAQMKEFCKIDKDDFKYYEIIRDVSETSPMSPFTGNFESFLKMIDF